MEFIHLTGKQLVTVVKDDELSLDDLKAAGLADETIVRINRQGDIEIRRPAQWDVVGGLIGDFERRLRGATGLDWA
jgi:hypothetical protein